MGVKDATVPLGSEDSDKKRMRVATSNPNMTIEGTTEGLTARKTTHSASPVAKKQKKSPNKDVPGEKRLRRFRKQPPQSYLEKLERATTQRMFVTDRIRGGSDDVPEETIEMVGTTGNCYNIKISLLPTCSCPDHKNGNQCKHIVYVLHNVLKAPEGLQYQLAFLSNELREIFAGAPLLPSSSLNSARSESSDSNRKSIEGDCPICFTPFSCGAEEIVYCKTACGNNIHKICFEQWAKSQSGKEVRCVYCRTPWQRDDEAIKRIVMDMGKVNREGYVNVAGELGLSGVRDYSTYHAFWVRQQLGHW